MIKSNRILNISALLVYAFLYIPLIIVIVYSFNDSKLNAEWVGFTLKWYDKLLSNDDLLSAAANSLIIASISALLATVLGTLAGIAIHKYRSRMLPALTMAPIAMPDILMGVSLLLFFILINMTLGLLSIVLAHITFCIGFVALSVQSRLSGMDKSLVEAARDLGATPWVCAREITLPLLAPGIIAGA
ncbi:MAG: ABC transporter permease subunit, partial [Gammaproteobacteria bacterium]|nr:ABC transporter permease subunit [Gammaproteobacteria bacterium]